MRIRPVLSTVAAVTVAGALSAGLAVGVAGAAGPYRSAAGLYELHLSAPGQGTGSAEMLLTPSHTVLIAGEATPGTWAQPGYNGTIVITIGDGDTQYVLTGLKMSNGIGSWNKRGTGTLGGNFSFYFWADLEPS